MYINSTLRQTLMIGGISLLAVVGLIGWTRRSDEAPVSAKSAQSTYLPAQFGNPEPVSRDSNGPVVYADSPFGNDTPSASYRAYGGPSPEPEPSYAMNSYAERTAMPSRVVPQRRSYTTSRGRRRYVIVRKRPFRRSVAIVGGSAAGGALIGALAGGGKGAAIGALAGGGGGLIYDRATHEKRLESER